jgi:hypothetical protein
MKKLYHKYTQLSSPIQLTILLLMLFTAFTLIDWLFDGKSAFTVRSTIQNAMQVVVLTVIINYKLVANVFAELKNKERKV